jgi:hypothetical protein
MSVVSGDDKFLTRYVMNKGGKIWHQTGEKCKLTTTFERGSRFMKQMLRWSRNTWRSDITLLFIERKIWWNNPFTALVIFDKLVTPFFLLYGMFYLPISSALKGDYVMFVGWLCWLMFSRFVRLAYYFWSHPLHIIFIPFWITFQYIQAIIRIIALFTLYERGWGTRSITFVGNTIQRDNNEEDALEVERSLQTPKEVVIETTVEPQTDIQETPKEEVVETSTEPSKEPQVESNTDATQVEDTTAKRSEFYNKKVAELKS